jgi:hypothetical protein
MDLGNSIHRFELDRKITLDRTGTLPFMNGSVQAIQENQKGENSIDSMNDDTSRSRNSSSYINPFISMNDPFSNKNFKKRKTMDLRFLKKNEDNLIDFDSECAFIETRPENSSSITLHNFPKSKTEIHARKSELFARKPHFPPTIKEKSIKNSKERTQSANNNGKNFLLNQNTNQSEKEWSSQSTTKEFSRQTTNQSCSIYSKRKLSFIFLN